MSDGSEVQDSGVAQHPELPQPGPGSLPPQSVALNVADEINTLLPETKGQIGLVAACEQAGITDRNEMVASGAAANNGAVGNLLINIRAIRDGQIPAAPSNARGALSAARSFLRQHRERLSADAINHLVSVIDQLETAINNPAAQEKEEEELQSKGAELEKVLEAQGGVYVYTFPHYWRYPTVEGTRRTLLKVGMSTREAALRVREQARGTAIPETPLILRVYQGTDRDLRSVERMFHSLLTAADHVRVDSNTGGREWFETSIEFLDTIAATLGLETLQADSPT